MSGERILVVDDEETIVKILRAYLEQDGYQVLTAADGQEALQIARRHHPDLVLLDLMLPKMSGWDVCRALHREWEVPVIMATARDDVTDRIVGLELGADDYMIKPFDPKEVLARVRAVLRRKANMAASAEPIIAGDLAMDIARHEVKLGGSLVPLTPTEFDLLRVLAQTPGMVHSRLELLDQIQGEAYEGYERTVDSHIRNLRQKIEPDPHSATYVLTVFGVGYKFSQDARNSAARSEGQSGGICRA